MSTWKTYSVWVERVERAHIEVKARNYDEAETKALNKADDVEFEEWTTPEMVHIRRVD